MGIHRFPLISNIQAAIPCGMYWNVLDLFMTWGPQRWVFDIWGDSHIVDYTRYLFCLVLCVCCLLSIGTGTQHQQKTTRCVSGDWTGGGSDVSVGRCYLALDQCHQPRTGCWGCWPAKSEHGHQRGLYPQAWPTSLSPLEEPEAEGLILFPLRSAMEWGQAKSSMPLTVTRLIHASDVPKEPGCWRSCASSGRSTSCSLWAPRRSSDVRVLLPPIWIYLPTGLG